MSQVNLTRRQALKSLGGVVVGVAATSMPGVSSAKALAAANISEAELQPFPPVVPRQGELKVSLVDSLDFTQSTLLISNISDSTLKVSTLLPSNIIVFDSNFDCRQALAKGPITLAPGKTFTTKVSSSPLSENSDDIVEYLDANESLSHLALGSRVVSLGGFMVGDAAVLYNDKAPDYGELQLA